ncbi:hypothetical protein QBC38DRAFT_248820 [Podospora fimiseda]|uniref:Rhodopsin domain-containing protein n=1 Tax=Podospora fimiseda TaxID=252190 RepID=A0AAN7BLR8_9PEZI|nr:hypothetical protein QBC38DRAFT_248820 [Podospora fimiseda]
MAADNNGPAMTITMVVCTVFSFLFMALRFYCKQTLSTKLGLDDAVLAFSWILFLVFVILSIHSTKYGLGKHFADVDLTLLPQLLYFLPIAQFFAVLSVAISKSSFILTLLRLVTRPWQKASLWFMLITINMSMFSISIVQFFQCAVPPTPGCVDGNHVIGLGVFAAGYSAVMDLVLTAFPSLVIWNLQMQLREKIGVIVSMSLGVVAGVIGIYKSSTIPYVARSADFTHGTAIVLIWLVAEVAATILAASIPFYRPLIRRATTARGTKESYGMGRVAGSHGHSKLSSQHDITREHIDEQPLTNTAVVRKTEINIEYDQWSDHEAGKVPGQSRREIF